MNLTGEQTTDNLNDDLEREYQSVMAYLAHARARTGALGQAIEDEREMCLHAELQQALTVCKQMEELAGDGRASPSPA